jgi:hypothetical protein
MRISQQQNSENTPPPHGVEVWLECCRSLSKTIRKDSTFAWFSYISYRICAKGQRTWHQCSGASQRLAALGQVPTHILTKLTNAMPLSNFVSLNVSNWHTRIYQCVSASISMHQHISAYNFIIISINVPVVPHKAGAKPLMDRQVVEVSSLSLSFSLFLWLSTYLPTFRSIYVSIYLSI